MVDKNSAGRYIASRNVRVKPEARKDPDVEQLARAFISIAQGLAEKKAAAEQIPVKKVGKGDAVP